MDEKRQKFTDDFYNLTRLIKLFADKYALSGNCLVELRFNFINEMERKNFTMQVLDIYQDFQPTAFPSMFERDTFGNYTLQCYGIKILLTLQN